MSEGVIKDKTINVRVKSHIADKAAKCAGVLGFNTSEYVRIALIEKMARDVKIWRDPNESK